MRLSHFSATVSLFAVFGDKLSHFSATVWTGFKTASGFFRPEAVRSPALNSERKPRARNPERLWGAKRTPRKSRAFSHWKKAVKGFHNNISYKWPHISRYLRNDAGSKNNINFTVRQHSFLCRALYSYSKSVRPSVRPYATRWHCVKTTQATIMRSSLEDSPMTSFLMVNFTAKFQRQHIGSEGEESQTGVGK